MIGAMSETSRTVWTKLASTEVETNFDWMAAAIDTFGLTKHFEFGYQ